MATIANQIEERKEEVKFFQHDLQEEEELFRLLQLYHDDVQAEGALEVIALEDEGLKLVMGELIGFMKDRHRLMEELKKLEN